MKSLGIISVTTAGDPVQLSATNILCNEICVQPFSALGASGTPPTENTGYVYLMRGDVAKGTDGASCVMALPPTAIDGRTVRAQKPLSLNVSEYWLDSDTDGDGGLITYA